MFGVWVIVIEKRFKVFHHEEGIVSGLEVPENQMKHDINLNLMNLHTIGSQESFQQEIAVIV